VEIKNSNFKPFLKNFNDYFISQYLFFVHLILYNCVLVSVCFNFVLDSLNSEVKLIVAWYDIYKYSQLLNVSLFIHNIIHSNEYSPFLIFLLNFSPQKPAWPTVSSPVSNAIKFYCYRVNYYIGWRFQKTKITSIRLLPGVRLNLYTAYKGTVIIEARDMVNPRAIAQSG